MGLTDLLFPRACLICGKGKKYICANCMGKVDRCKSICPICGRPSIDGLTHVKCSKPWSLDGLTSAWTYEGVIRRAIIKLKYKFAYEIAEEIVENFTPLIKSFYLLNNFSDVLLIPVPSHRLRKNWRGFNQTELIGKMVAKKMGWKFNSKVLFRKKNVVPQINLRAKDRVENVRGIFGLRKEGEISLSSHKETILFDDVWTTGSTMKEAGKVLKRNGFKKVWALTLSR